MKHTLFSEKMKVADLVLANYRLLYVFPCFGLGIGFGESTVKQVCEKNNISIPLFLLVCNLYTFDDYYPDAKVLTQIPLDDLMKYLKNSHKSYLEERMPHIISRILNLVDGCHVKNGKMLTEFCEKYRLEVIAHFNYEEQVVFPYIRSLLEGKKNNTYKIKVYENNHSDLDAALNDLKNILIKYLPPECTVEKCRDVLIDLFLFEYDLSRHTLLEDQILVASVERMEHNLP
ncbi:cation-binding protein [Bacteroidia bacterium]|nr:cation-binding protein [Bacteroidia bacterium]